MMNYFHCINRKSQRLRDLSRSQQSSFAPSVSGQAMIEYLLMLLVAIILISGLTLAVFKPLNDFLARLNNMYIRCLLETGELPKVGNEGTGQCDAELPKFEAKNMDGSTPGKDGKGSQTSENQKGESSSANGDSGTAVGSAGGAGAGSAAGGRKSSMIRNGMRTNGTARGEQNGNKVTNIPIDSFNEGEGFMNIRDGGGYGRKGTQTTRKLALSALTEYERKQIEREQEKTRSVAIDTESFAQNAKKKIKVKPPEEKIKDEDIQAPSDYGSYFKVFFMIIIVLFIIILMGSQALQMTNNSDS